MCTSLRACFSICSEFFTQRSTTLRNAPQQHARLRSVAECYGRACLRASAPLRTRCERPFTLLGLFNPSYMHISFYLSTIARVGAYAYTHKSMRRNNIGTRSVLDVKVANSAIHHRTAQFTWCNPPLPPHSHQYSYSLRFIHAVSF